MKKPRNIERGSLLRIRSFSCVYPSHDSDDICAELRGDDVVIVIGESRLDHWNYRMLPILSRVGLGWIRPYSAGEL